MAKRLSNSEAKNTKLIHDNQPLLEQVNIVINQKNKDHDALVRTTEEISKFKAATEDVKKMINKALSIAE